MRWRKITNFIPALFFSIGYIILTIFNLMGTSHPPSIEHPNAESHVFSARPLVGLIYLVVALLISWGVYYYYQEKATLTSFAVSMVTGIIMICVGIVLWVSVIY